MKKNIILAITGASGAIIGVRLARELKRAGCRLGMVISKWGEKTIEIETDLKPDHVKSIADRCYAMDSLDAEPASGSCETDAMVIAPCSMKTLSAIACGYSDNLITRAADVCIKESRKIIIVPRETPLSEIHLKNMLTLARAGAVILPPMPAFYLGPQTVEEMVEQIVGKILNILDIHSALFNRWQRQ